MGVEPCRRRRGPPRRAPRATAPGPARSSPGCSSSTAVPSTPMNTSRAAVTSPASSRVTRAPAPTRAKSPWRRLTSSKAWPVRAGAAGHAHLGEHLVAAQRGGEVRLEQVGRGDRAGPAGADRGHRGAQQQGHRRPLGGRVVVGQRAAEGAPVAHRGVGHERRHLGQQRHPPRHLGVAPEAGVGGRAPRSPGRRRRPRSCRGRRTRPMSTSTLGRPSRRASSGSRLWPPARILASSPASTSAPTTPSTVSGATYANGGGFTPGPPPVERAASGRASRR